MPIFTATETRHDGRYGVEFEADDWQAAETHCAERGWQLCGTLEVIIDADSNETLYDRSAADFAIRALLWSEK